MKKNHLSIEVWVVTAYNTIEGANYTKVHSDCDSAVADYEDKASKTMLFAVEELSDFRVSKNLNSTTICDGDDNRVVAKCEVIKDFILCGTMCM